MARKHKRKLRFVRKLRPEAVAAVLVLGALGLGVQAQANLGVRHTSFAHQSAVKLAAPATPTPKPPAPTLPPPPSATPAPRVAVVRRRIAPVPVVKPAPNSSVSNLAPVTSPPPGSTGLGGAPNPTGSPAASSSPTPSAAPVFAYSSSNWAGYLASAGQFTGVAGSWTVPSVAGNGVSTSADAAWVGIGGVISPDLIQTGTDDTVSRSGQVSTIAFYELLPDSETPVPGMTVTPGDTMSADITNLGGTLWRISIADVTRSENFSIDVTYSSSLSTAEWIEEDPSFSRGGLVPFDNFGFVGFSGATTTENGATTTLTGAGAQAIIMLDSHGQAVATPSVISGNGEGFSVSGG